jgi:hypothetical protein
VDDQNISAGHKLYRATANGPGDRQAFANQFRWRNNTAIIGRLCGYGTVAVTSVGGMTFPLRCLRSPQIFHTTLQKAVNDAKKPALPASKFPTQPPDDDSRFMPKS